MKKWILIIYALLHVHALTSGQDKIKLYFNSNWEVTNKERAAYRREADYDLKNFILNGKVTDRDLKGILMMEGNYISGKRNGEFTFYYSNGNIECKGTYFDNNQAGKWIYFYPNSQLKQTIYFNHLNQEDFRVGEFFSRDGQQLLRNGTGTWQNDSMSIQYGKPYILRITGHFKDSLKNGKWKLLRVSDKRLLQTERYKKGELKIVKYGYISSKKSSTFDSSTRTGERIQNEMRTGISHDVLIEDPTVELQERNRNYVRIPEHMVDDRRDLLSYTQNTSIPNSGISVTLSKVEKSRALMTKFPDQHIGKLNNTEKINLDTLAFPKSLMDADLKRLIKTISITGD